jgi:hypothetical protein
MNLALAFVFWRVGHGLSPEGSGLNEVFGVLEARRSAIDR